MSEHEQCIQAAKDFSKALADYEKRLENEKKWQALISQKNQKMTKIKTITFV